VSSCLFRLRLPDGSYRLARGDVAVGPQELLAPDLTLKGLLAADRAALGDALAQSNVAGAIPEGARIAAPVDEQEVWAAGVTYERSRAARMEESAEPSVYDHVYEAQRPELFFKAPAWRVRAAGEPIGIRADSDWDVPEPELALVITSDLEIAGYTIGNDVSSRSIEGENPLYLPQAKFYDASCALGPGIVPVSVAQPPFAIGLLVLRDGVPIVEAETSSARIRRDLGELARVLGRALTLPAGAVLLTGTGIVPADDFSLRPGDTVRIEIDGLGVLENPVEQVGLPAQATQPAQATHAEVPQASVARR
jgi:2-dehydro-3-deoxy-D-arabinonate dehydratase